MGRRSQGEGSIYPVKKGGRIIGFAGSLDLGYSPDGKRIRKKVEARTKRECMEKLAILKERHGAGIDITATPQRISVLLERWIRDVYADTARESSVVKYRWAFAKVDPHIGQILVTKLTAMRAQQLTTDLKETGLSASSVSQIIVCLKSAFGHFVKPWRLIAENPFDDVVKPAAKPKSAIFLSPEQALILLEAARGHRYELAILLMLTLGLRRGEICAVRWSDVDFDRQRLSVSGTLDVRNGGPVRGDTKTDHSARLLPLPATAVARLTWHRAQQTRERQLLGLLESEYIFTSAERDALNPNLLYVALKKIIAGTDLPQDLTPHDLRHSCASFLIAQNVHPKVISEVLGHASIGITLDLYGHLFPDQLDDAIGKVSDVLNQSSGEAKGREKAG